MTARSSVERTCERTQSRDDLETSRVSRLIVSLTSSRTTLSAKMSSRGKIDTSETPRRSTAARLFLGICGCVSILSLSLSFALLFVSKCVFVTFVRHFCHFQKKSSSSLSEQKYFLVKRIFIFRSRCARLAIPRNRSTEGMIERANNRVRLRHDARDIYFLSRYIASRATAISANKFFLRNCGGIAMIEE